MKKTNQIPNSFKKTLSSILIQFILILGMICFSLIASESIALAETPTATQAPPSANGGSTPNPNGLSGIVRNIGGQTSLPSYDNGHASQSYHAGASQITSAIYFIIDFLKYVLGGIAVIMIIISGFKLVIAGRGVDDAMNREKETLRFAFSGLLVILLADQFIRVVFFGEEGEVYRTPSDVTAAAQRSIQLTTGIDNLIKIFIPSIAVLFFVIAGIRMVISRGEPDQLNKAKTQMTWAIAGLVLAGLAQLVVTTIIFPNNGTTLSDPQAFAKLVITMTNFIAGFMSTVAVSMIIYAGYIYTVSLGGDGVDKAKKILIGAIVGLLIAMAAFGLVNTFVHVEPLKDATNTNSSTAVKTATP